MKMILSRRLLPYVSSRDLIFARGRPPSFHACQRRSIDRKQGGDEGEIDRSIDRSEILDRPRRPDQEVARLRSRMRVGGAVASLLNEKERERRCPRELSR